RLARQERAQASRRQSGRRAEAGRRVGRGRVTAQHRKCRFRAESSYRGGFPRMSTVNGRANGARRNGARGHKVRVAIVGVGNCASSFVQGVQYYKDADSAEQVPGLMHVDLGGDHVRDIEFTAAFDIDSEKGGKDLSEAIFSGQNNTYKFSDVPKLGVKVHRGMTHDGLGKYLKEKITKAPGETADIVGILQETQTDG